MFERRTKKKQKSDKLEEENIYKNETYPCSLLVWVNTYLVHGFSVLL